ESDYRSRFDKQESKYSAHKEMLEKQAEVLRAMQERVAEAEKGQAKSKGDASTMLEECMALRAENRRLSHQQNKRTC
ncbi:hypothetical protein T484DRAFT_1807667, partial [Baffinella frigidus]